MCQILDALSINADTLCQLLECRFSGDDDGDWFCLLLVGVYADVCYHSCGTVYGLELLDSNVLAVEGLDQVLLAVDYLEMAIVVELTNIASLEPSIRSNGVFGFFLIVVVFLQDWGAPDPDLALGVWLVGCVVASVGEIDEFDLDGARDVAEGVVGPFVGVHEGAHRGGFR